MSPYGPLLTSMTNDGMAALKVEADLALTARRGRLLTRRRHQ